MKQIIYKTIQLISQFKVKQISQWNYKSHQDIHFTKEEFNYMYIDNLLTQIYCLPSL